MSNIKSFLNLSYLTYKSTNLYQNKTQFILMKILLPIFQLLFFAIIGYFGRGMEYMEFVVVGNATYTICLTTIMGVVTSIARDREIGTLPLIFLSPRNKLSILLSKTLVNIFDGFISSFIAFAITKFFFNIQIELLDAVILVIILFVLSICLSMIGIFFGCLALVYKDTVSIANLTVLIILFVSGVNFPVEELPFPLFVLAQFSPLTFGLDIIRPLIDGEGLELLNFFKMVLVGLVYLALAITIYKFVEIKALKQSEIDY